MGCTASQPAAGGEGAERTNTNSLLTEHDASLQLEVASVGGIGNSKLENFIAATKQAAMPIKDKVNTDATSSTPRTILDQETSFSSPSSSSFASSPFSLFSFLKKWSRSSEASREVNLTSNIDTDYVRLGMSLSFLDQFIESVCGGRKQVQDLTLKQVQKKFILPYVKKSGTPNMALTSLLEHRQAQQEAEGGGTKSLEYAAPATWFVVYNEKDHFVNIADTIKNFFSGPRVSNEDTSDGGGRSGLSKDNSNDGLPTPVYVFIDVFSESPNSSGSNIYFTDSFPCINVLHVVSDIQGVDSIRQCELGVLLSKSLSCRYELVMIRSEEDLVVSMMGNGSDIIESILNEIDTLKLGDWLKATPQRSRHLHDVIKFLRNGFHKQFDIHIATSIENMLIALIQRFIKNCKVEGSRLMELRYTFYLAGVHLAAERYGKAQALYDQVLTGRRAELGDEHIDTLHAQHHLSLAYHRQGNYVDAEPLLRNCLDVSKTSLGEEDPCTLQIMHDLASVYTQQYMYKSAEPMFQTCLRLRREIYGECHEDVLKSLKALADLYCLKQDYHAAEPLYLLCLNGHQDCSGGEMNKTILLVMNNLAELYNHRADYQSAENLYIKIMHELIKSSGPTHRSTLDVMENLGSCYRYQYKFEDALPLCEDVLKHRKLIYGDTHPKVMQSINNLANCYDGLGKGQQATELHLKHSRGQLTATD